MEGMGELGDKWPREPASRDRFGREERVSRGAPCAPKWSPWEIRALEGAGEECSGIWAIGEVERQGCLFLETCWAGGAVQLES